MGGNVGGRDESGWFFFQTESFKIILWTVNIQPPKSSYCLLVVVVVVAVPLIPL